MNASRSRSALRHFLPAAAALAAVLALSGCYYPYGYGYYYPGYYRAAPVYAYPGPYYRPY